LSYKDQFSQRIAGLLDKIFELRMLHLHGERVADILLAAPEEEGQACEVDLSHRDASIQVCNVSFRYGESEPYVLRNLSLHIQAGQCVAITGVSGCGKTTLLKLMLGLLTPCEGEILIGGVDLQRLGLSNYRRMTGTVMQDDHLFTGTLSDNICFFDTQPDQEKVTSSARQAAVHEEIMAMPMNYNTLVGDIGSGLSAGQRQRILLARALYRAPSLLILDEATSHLDTWNEKLVNAAIAHEDMTRLLVAHRPETIAMAQRVITLEQGQIVSDVVQREAVSTALHVAVTLPEASGSS
jgi:ATP-binding cassette subfamily B protein RaxB